MPLLRGPLASRHEALEHLEDQVGRRARELLVLRWEDHTSVGLRRILTPGPHALDGRELRVPEDLGHARTDLTGGARVGVPAPVLVFQTAVGEQFDSEDRFAAHAAFILRPLRSSTTFARPVATAPTRLPRLTAALAAAADTAGFDHLCPGRLAPEGRHC